MYLASTTTTKLGFWDWLSSGTGTTTVIRNGVLAQDPIDTGGTTLPKLKDGYLYSPDGTVIGPRGGIYDPSGAQDANGNVIFKNGNSFVTLAPDTGRLPVKSPFTGTVADNYQQGRNFQGAVNDAFGWNENFQTLSAQISNGTTVTTRPDNYDPSTQYGILEAKSNIYLTDSPQMEAQRVAAQALGLNYTLVIAPYTRVSQTLVNSVYNDGGSIWRFDPKTGQQTPYHH
jgi:filamentous hemagglutinin